jgi:hypothetical protein
MFYYILYLAKNLLFILIIHLFMVYLLVILVLFSFLCLQCLLYMARLRYTARKSVIPFLPSRIVERPLRCPVAGQSSHLERLHHCLHEEQVHRRQELEQQDSSFSLQQEIESARSCSPVLPMEAPPAPPLSAPAAGVAARGDPDEGGGDSISSHNTDLSEEQELEGWVARPITCDAAHGCHFHDALDTLLR